MKTFHILISLFLVISFAYGQEKDVALTVYNNDLALVKDVRKMELRKGKTMVTFKEVAATIDPTSVHFKSLTAPDAVAILEQNFEYDLVNSNKILQKYIDHEIIVHTKQSGPFQGVLLSSDGNDIILRLKNDKIIVISAEAIINIEFPGLPQGLITRPTLVWYIDNNKSGTHKVEVSYLTSAINWHAEYVAVTKKEDSILELSSWVSIDNKTGTDYENARLKLIAGDVHRVQVPRALPRAKGYAVMAERAAPPQFEEKSFFEYHLYTLQRRTTVKNNQIKQISLFPTREIKVKKVYVYNGAQHGSDVRVNLEFKNNKAAGLGIPLPAGKIRVYKEDEKDKALEFIGEDKIKHTPKDENVRIYLGNAFDIKGERVSKSKKRMGDKSREEVWEIKLRNHTDKAVQIIVVEKLWGDWEIRKSSHSYKKKDANTIEFLVPVEKDGETTIEYTVLFKW